MPCMDSIDGRYQSRFTLSFFSSLSQTAKDSLDDKIVHTAQVPGSSLQLSNIKMDFQHATSALWVTRPAS